MAERLIFSQTFEGLLRSVSGGKLSPRLAAGLKERGVDPAGKLLPAYPAETFVSVVNFVGRELYPGLSVDDAITQVGRGFMDAYGETMVGRAMLAMIRLIGPRRTLERVTRQFRTGNNYYDTRLTPLGPTEYDLWINVVTMPGWYIGILSRGLELAGAKDVSVRMVSHDSQGGTFRITWAGS